MHVDRARREAELTLEAAQRQAHQVVEKTDEQVAERLVSAQRAADAVLGRARAISQSLQGVADALGNRAERLAEDLATAHEELSAELRAAGRAPAESVLPPLEGTPRAAHAGDDGSAPESVARLERTPPTDRAPAPPRRRSTSRNGRTPSRDSGEGFEVPSWVDRPS